MFLINDYYISRLKKEELKQMVSFVVSENYLGHQGVRLLSPEASSEIKTLLKEDLEFFDNSVYYVLRRKRDRKLYGSIKLTRCNTQSILPIHQLFGLSNMNALNDKTNIWHIGRFAISNKIPYKRITILKKLLFNAFYPLNKIGEGMVFAECDKKLTGTLKTLGVDSLELGCSLNYLGSETLPISIKSNWLDSYILSNSERYLTEDNIDDCAFFLNKYYN